MTEHVDRSRPVLSIARHILLADRRRPAMTASRGHDLRWHRQELIQFNHDTLWIGSSTNTGAYQAFGDMFIDLAHVTVTQYRRELDIERAVHTVRTHPRP